MAAAPCRNRFTPTVRTSPEIKKECHLGEPEAESSIRIANVRVIDMISVTPVRVRSSCTCRAPGHIGDAAALDVNPFTDGSRGRRVGSTTTPVTLAPQPLNQIGNGGRTAWRHGRRRGDN